VIDPSDIEVEFSRDGLWVLAVVEPGDPGEHTLRNGDPGNPPTPPMADVVKVCVEDLDELFATFDELALESLRYGWPLMVGCKLTPQQCAFIPASWWEDAEDLAIEEAEL
jgi:hypothetical protein